MIIKLRIGHIRITFTIATVIDVLGVNSKLNDKEHILMWDFDKQDLSTIIDNLQVIQHQFELPQIFILKSSEPNNYISYCFVRLPWTQARAIVGMTDGIDEAYFKWGVFRKRFTLRVGAKLGVKPKLAFILKSRVPDQCTIEELRSWVKYETLDGHHNQMVHFIEVP